MNDNNINKYYSVIDNNVLNDSCKNNDINLSVLSEINIFNKKKKYQLKSKKKLLKECENKKNESTTLISNLAKLKIDNKIENINKIITCINKLKDDNYIECYSND
jgi:hypothetical protein